MSDTIIRAIAGNGAIRAFFASTQETVEAARAVHDLSPTAAAALGRLLTAAAIMGQTLKDDGETLTIRIKCDGPLGGMLATASNSGRVKGYAVNPDADAPRKADRKLNVSGIVGSGSITVIKDMGLKEPYVGQVPLVSGEIAEDIANYYAVSEQTPCAVALGVLVNPDGTIKQAGGFFIQLMPGAPEDIISALETKTASFGSVTGRLDSGMSARDMLFDILGSFGVEITDEITPEYKCDCSKERVGRALISLGKKELLDILEKDKKARAECHFCRKTYEFSDDELRKLIADATGE